MRKRYKVFLSLIIVVVFLISGISLYMKFFRKTNNIETNKSKVVNSIESYGYSLDDRDSNLMKEEFHNLEKILEAEEINYEEYAKSISKLFVIDLYSINNKINKYDIGGLEYIKDSEQEKFTNIIVDSIYSNVLDNSNHDRKQELPEVSNVTIEEIKFEPFNLNDIEVDAYSVTISWNYLEDLGYDKKAVIKIVQEEEKLYIVEYQPVNEEAGV